MGKKSSNPPAPPPDPAIGRSQEMQSNIAQEQWDDWRNVERPYIRGIMENQERRQQEVQDELLSQGRETREYGQRQREWGQRQQDKYTGYADEARRRWETDFRPAEDFIVKDARDYNTEGNFQQQARNASGDIAAAFQNQRQAAAIQRQSYGINPSSGNAQAAQGGLDASEAAMRAGAMTRARDAAVQLGWDKQMNVAQMGQGALQNQQAYSNMGQGMGGYALGASEAGLGSTTSGMGVGQMGIQNRMALQGLGNSTAGGVAGMYNNVGQLGVSNYGIRSNQWASRNAAAGQQAAGTGQAIGAVAGVAAIAI